MSPCHNAGGVLICTRRGPKMCRFCQVRPMTKLCDAPKGGMSFGTCDAEMCDTCATSGGKNVDYCPPHKHLAKKAEEVIPSKTRS